MLGMNVKADDVVQVTTITGYKWLVGHRYKEFSQLRSYIHSEMSRHEIQSYITHSNSSSNVNAQESSRAVKSRSPSPLTENEPPFPPKHYIMSTDLISRKTGLQNYINFLMRMHAFNNHNVLTAMLAFLEVSTDMFMRTYACVVACR
jgi:hypothetical protein